LTRPGRGGTAVAPGTFAYLPNITGINPNQGTSLGGTEVTLTGAFAPGFTYVFGTTPPTGVSCSSTKCTMVTPANAPGPVNVVAQTPSGVGNSVSHNGFTYLGLAVTGFSPKVGPTAGGTLVTLEGTSMINGMTVNFGGAATTDVSCTNNGTVCTLLSPPHTAGSFPVNVTSNGVTVALSGQFTFEVFPSITGISPSSGTTGTVVTLTGTGFSKASTSFSFFGIQVPGTCSSTTTCTAAVPQVVGVVTGTTGVYATVNGNTSLNAVDFSYFQKTKVCTTPACLMAVPSAPVK